MAPYHHFLRVLPNYCAMPVGLILSPRPHEIASLTAISVYVGMPRIAQHDVNRSHLEITEIQFLDPTSDSILISQKAILHSPSTFTPTLDPFSAANYLLTNGVYGPEPMIYLPMPKIHALHPQSNASIEGARVHIESLDQVAAYATACLTNEEVEVALVGKTTLHLGSLPSVGINYNTTTTHKGLNGLKGFNVTDAKINITETRKTFPNLHGNAYIPNPSVLTIAMVYCTSPPYYSAATDITTG